MGVKLGRAAKYIATPAKVFVTLSVILIAIVILQLLISSTVPIFLIESRPEVAPKDLDEKLRIPRANKMFLADGTVRLVCGLEASNFNVRTYEDVQVYDSNDRLLWTGEYDDQPYHYVAKGKSFECYHPERLVFNITQWQMIDLNFSKTLTVPVVSPEGSVIQQWRYEPARKMFIGFDSNGREIGYAGSNGFAKAKKEAKPFGEYKGLRAWCPAESTSPIFLWQTESKLHKINFEQQKLKLVLDTGGEEIFKFDMDNWGGLENVEIPGRPHLYAITKMGSCYLLLDEPEQRLKFQLPKDWFPYYINFTSNEDGIFLTYAGAQGAPVTNNKKLWAKWCKQDKYKQHKEWIELYRVASNGPLKFLSRFEWTKPASSQRNAKQKQRQEAVIQQTKRYLTAISTPLYGLLSQGSESDLLSELRPAYPISNLSISLMMTCIVLLHAWSRRTGNGRLIFWLVLAALFNMAGFLTYLALNHTTVIRCSTCGKKRGLERGDCPACKALLPIPECRETDLILVGQSNS
jgi:hypothetical protein